MDDDEDDAGSSLQKYENLCRGLTDEQRREIRQSQRSLRKEIPDLDISEASRRNNKIHENIRYIRESVLDADNLYAIVKKACNKIQTFQVGHAIATGAITVASRITSHSSHMFLSSILLSFRDHVMIWRN